MTCHSSNHISKSSLCCTDWNFFLQIDVKSPGNLPRGDLVRFGLLKLEEFVQHVVRRSRVFLTFFNASEGELRPVSLRA